MSSKNNKYGRNLQTYLQASSSPDGGVTPSITSSRRDRARTRSGCSSSSDSSSITTPTPTPSPSPSLPPHPPSSPLYHHHHPHHPLLQPQICAPIAPHPHHPHLYHQPQLAGSSWSLSSAAENGGGRDHQRTPSVSSLPAHLSSSSNHESSDFQTQLQQTPELAPTTNDSSSLLEQNSSPQSQLSQLYFRSDYELLTRPAWVDAEIGLESLEAGEATGNRSALWLRALVQLRFAELGTAIQAKAGLVLFLGLVLLVTCTVGLKGARLETRLERLWVEEGGRLSREMQYVRDSLGEGAGTTNEILIQTPRGGQESVLYADAMLLHWEALRFALEASVDLFEANWKLRDICYRPATPTFESHSIDSFLERLIPCSIITPLDCFWEGSYLLGPEVPVAIPFLAMPVEWTTLNPEALVGTMMANLKAYRRSELGPSPGGRSATWELEAFYKFMRSSGITTGYQMKPCLNPANPNCPSTAPNYNSNLTSSTSAVEDQTAQKGPDIGATLTGGCFGFATKYMHWPEDLIVGGVTRNRTGHITGARALQSIVQLMGEQALYERYQSDYKVHNTDWSVEKAKAVLEAWQRAFQGQLKTFLANEAAEAEDEVEDDDDDDQEDSRRSSSALAAARTQNLELFTSASVNDLMRSASEPRFTQLAVAFVLMAAYVGVSLHRAEVEESQSFVGVLGVLLLVGGLLAGFGLCAMLGLPFNAVTNLVLPLLCLGMGLDNLFLLARIYSSDYMVKCVPLEGRTAETLKQASTSLLITILSTTGCLLAASIIPMPGLRIACFQASILHGCLSLVVLLFFPALVSLVYRFRLRYLLIGESLTYQAWDVASGQRLLAAGNPYYRHLQMKNGGASGIGGHSPPKTLVNLFFLLCCCGLAPKRFRSNNEKKNIAQNSSNCGISSVSCGQYSAPVPCHLQAYNYYYVNSIQQRPDPMVAETSPAKSSKTSKIAKSSSLDSGIDQMELGSPTSASSSTDEKICCCGTSTTPINSDKEEELHKLVGKKCTTCGGDLRPQCEGQDETSTFEQEGEKLTSSSSSTSQLQNSQLVVKMPEESSSKTSTETLSKKSKFKLTAAHLATTWYIPLLSRKPIKALVLLAFIFALILSALGALRLEDGLDLAAIVPADSGEHRFLDAQRTHFSFFYMYAVTMGNFDYPNNQRLLQEYHDAFTRIPAIVKNDDGGLPPFWLSLFRDWLRGLQAAFDRDWAAGVIDSEGWRKENASEDGILGFKLLVQTGRIDNPIDKGLLTTNRLVDPDSGVINPKAFYNYLTAWVHTDVMAYAASEGNFVPDPSANRKFSHDSHDTELKIPKAAPLTYAQMPFQLNAIRSTAEITQTIEQVRAICRKFEVDRGLPNFPTGAPFTYWEQYVWLRFYVGAGLAVALAVVYFTFSLLLLSPWSAALAVLILAATVLEVVGLMGWLAIKLSAVPGVVLILSVALSVSLLTHVLISFSTSVGDRNRRMAMSLEHMFTPVKNSVLSTLIAVAMLGFAQFDFIFEYFFLVLSAVLLCGALNTLVLLPVLLSICGPSADVQPLDFDGVRIGTPEPLYGPAFGCKGVPSQVPASLEAPNCLYRNQPATISRSQPTRTFFSKPRANFRRGGSGRIGGGRDPARVMSEISLSTISEEPNSYASSSQFAGRNTPSPHANLAGGVGSSQTPVLGANSQPNQQQQHEIVVQPEFVFEATAHFTNNSNGNNGNVVSSNANASAAHSVTPTSENSSSNSDSSSVSSPSPTSSSSSSSSDRDSPSGRSESAASNVQTGRPSSATSFTTTTNGDNNSSTTVTAKVMATAKLTIPMVSPFGHHQHLTAGQPHPLALYGMGVPPSQQPMGGYPHTHLTPEPCRSCLGCMLPLGMVPAQPGPMTPMQMQQQQQPIQHPQMHQPQSRQHQQPQPPQQTQMQMQRQQQQFMQAPGGGAWNHGMLGPVFGSSNNISTSGLPGRRNPAGWR